MELIPVRLLAAYAFVYKVTLTKICFCTFPWKLADLIRSNVNVVGLNTSDAQRLNCGNSGWGRVRDGAVD